MLLHVHNRTAQIGSIIMVPRVIVLSNFILPILALASSPTGQPHTAMGESERETLKVLHTQNSLVVSQYDVFELTFQHAKEYDNPFLDVRIDVTLISPSSKPTHVGGFYYKQDLWKARFASSESGRWMYRFEFTNDNGQTASGEGTFLCVKGRKPHSGFVRQHPKNPFRFVFDDGTPFFPIGLQDCWGDNSGTGSVLDQCAMEGPFRTDLKDPPPLPAGPMFLRGPSCNPQNADVYFRYFSQSGFNLYRFSQKNCSYDLYRDLDHYLVQEGIMTDELLQYARKYSFRIFYGIFGYQPVFNKDPENVEGLAKVKRFIKYSVDRWGAYVDFWEFLNEQHANDRWYEIMIPYLRSTDPYQHMITTSWEKPDLDGIEINAPHWYQRENELESDSATATRAGDWKQYHKPVIVGEQGNHIDRKRAVPAGVGGVWDNNSAVRMRVRNWTALFHEIAFVFWNTSYARDGHFMNIWLGPKEREYVRAMQDFAYRLDSDVSIHSVDVSAPDAVRAYALASRQRAGVYLHHFKNHTDPIENLQIALTVADRTKGYWYAPANASILKVIDLAEGLNQLNVPPFTVDIALLVTPDGPPDIDRDGQPNDLDSDDDNDGVSDLQDAFPLDPYEWKDEDQDWIGDNLDADDNGDGIADDENKNGIPDHEELDIDGDGVQRSGAVPWDAFPLDSKEWQDTDGDGIGDNRDTDDDNDGFSDAEEQKDGSDPLDKLSFPLM